MLDSAISPDQVRARAGVTFAVAQQAVYMRISASEGWTLAEFIQRTGMTGRSARALAYRFGIEFPDYPPSADPVDLVWRKAEKGWDLYHGEKVLGTCRRASDGQYIAETVGKSQGAKVMEIAWDPRGAMSRVGGGIDALSPVIFDGQPVRVSILERDGSSVTLFPTIDETFHACRKAFDA